MHLKSFSHHKFRHCASNVRYKISELASIPGCSPDERSAVGWAEVRSWALKHSTVVCLPVKKLFEQEILKLEERL